MPMTSASVPHLRENITVAEVRKTEAPKAPEKPAPKLARASESSDAAVHNLLAEQEIHRMNGDDKKVADTVRRLAELGYA
jgi:hypothetical protein